jgi:hypothetical protein
MTRTITPADYPEIIAAAKTAVEIYSAKFATLDVSELGFTGESTGTITGVLEIWGSNKIAPNEVNDDDWHLCSCVFPSAPAGAAWKDYLDVASANLFWYRIKLNLSGGAGTWSADVNRKGIG